MEKYKKATVVTTWVYFVVSSLVTFFEYPNVLIHPQLYLISKIFLQIWLLGLCIWIGKKPYGVMPNLWVGIHVFCSNIHGQYFMPWYIFSFIEMVMAYAFLYPLPRRHFNALLAVGTLGFGAMAAARYEGVYQALYDSQVSDLVTVIFTAAVVAYLAHNFFTSDRTYREALLRKFGIIGLQTANVIHDIKSMLATPSMNLDILKTHLQTIPQNTEMLSLVVATEKQLLGIHQAMTGLNEVVALQDQTKQSFSLSDAILEVSETLSLPMRQVQLQIHGDVQVYCEKALLKSVVFNVLMNSVQAFRKRHTQKPKITISCKGNTADFCDNAGGFSNEVLPSLRSSSFNSSDGVGMGLFLVSNGMQSLGGSSQFLNTEDGACVRLVFALVK